MGVLDEHNRQHTYGNSLGPPNSVVGVSAQLAIDAHQRLVESAGRTPSSGRPINGVECFYFAIGAGAIALIVVAVAYMLGGIAAVALGLIAFVAGIFAIVFLVAALINGAKSTVSAMISQRRRTPNP